MAMDATMNLLATHEAVAARVNRPGASAEEIAQAQAGAARVVENTNREFATTLRVAIEKGIPPYSDLLKQLDTYADLTARAATLTGREIKPAVSPSVRPAMEVLFGELKGLVTMLAPAESAGGDE
jgi:hypothetical protein